MDQSCLLTSIIVSKQKLCVKSGKNCVVHVKIDVVKILLHWHLKNRNTIKVQSQVNKKYKSTLMTENNNVLQLFFLQGDKRYAHGNDALCCYQSLGL